MEVAGNERPAPAIWSQQLTPTGTALAAGPPSVLLTPSEPWQGGIVEGPDMAVSGGQYRLFYSANSWTTSDYAIGVANCSGPVGPCTEPSNTPLVTSQAGFSGPGGPSTFTDAQGTLWLAFHAWLPGAIGYPNSRLLFLRQVTVTAGGAAIGP
jgi:beta-xylosidase